MSRADKQERKLYLDVNDATAELGITRRQLRHWEDNGLLEPELGRNRYTKKDLEQLRLIKRLVVEEGFPVGIVRRLFEKQLWDGESDEVEYTRARSGDLTNSVLDIDSGALIQREEMFKRLWQEFLASADEPEIEARLAELILVYFRSIRSQSRTPVGYIGQVADVIERVRDLSRVARLEYVYAEEDRPAPVIGIRLQPLLPDEASEGEELDALFDRNEPVVTALQEMETEVLLKRGRPTKRGRFEHFGDYQDLRR